MEYCKVTRFQIYFHPKSEYDSVTISDYYDIYHIDYLTKLINTGYINTIKCVIFYFNIGLSHGAIIYHCIKDGNNYIFAPCYNRMTFESILDYYKTHMINNLMTTIHGFSSDIKKTFIHRIDESQEIIHVFEDD